LRGSEFFGRVARAVTLRPLVTIAVVAAFALAGLVLASTSSSATSRS
jgi:hypothetical protein